MEFPLEINVEMVNKETITELKDNVETANEGRNRKVVEEAETA